MNKFFIDKYLNNLKFVRKLDTQLDDILENKLEVIDLISAFILDNQEYLRLESFKRLVDILVNFIEEYNSNLLNEEEIKNYVSKFKIVIKNLENEISSECKLSVYFYGKDKYGFIENNLTHINIISVNSLKELQVLASSNKKNKNSYNILLLENQNFILKNKYFDEVLPYNKIAESLETIGNITFKQKYELNFLQCGLERCMEEQDINSIIIGNSYPLVGISEHNINRKAVKLCMHSQDLYYSIELAKKAIELNKNIKECIFGISYYLLRHDLSKCTNEYSKSLMRKIYYPLLKDSHNSNLNYKSKLISISDYNVDILVRSIFDLKKIENFISKKLYFSGKTFYNNITNYKEINLSWNNLSDEDKYNMALDRAYSHNKLFKYENTKIEYTNLLKEFVDFLKDKNIKLTVVVLPTTKQYQDNLLIDLKNEFEFILDYLRKRDAYILDLRKYENKFNDLDFADSDHLNSCGEKKATDIINSINITN